jgi:hypothetical protein
MSTGAFPSGVNEALTFPLIEALFGRRYSRHESQNHMNKAAMVNVMTSADLILESDVTI